VFGKLGCPNIIVLIFIDQNTNNYLMRGTIYLIFEEMIVILIYC